MPCLVFFLCNYNLYSSLIFSLIVSHIAGLLLSNYYDSRFKRYLPFDILCNSPFLVIFESSIIRYSRSGKILSFILILIMEIIIRSFQIINLHFFFRHNDLPLNLNMYLWGLVQRISLSSYMISASVFSSTKREMSSIRLSAIALCGTIAATPITII